MGNYKKSQIFIKILQNFRFCRCEIRVFEVAPADWKSEMEKVKTARKSKQRLVDFEKKKDCKLTSVG